MGKFIKIGIYCLVISFILIVCYDMHVYGGVEPLEGDVEVLDGDVGLFIKSSDLTAPESKMEIVNRCKGLDLDDMANCFLDNIVTFFDYYNDRVRYTESGDGDGNVIKDEYWIYDEETENATLTEIDLLDYLKENGGICTEWSLLYEQLCEETEFSCEKITEGGIENVVYGHMYAVMYDENNWCKLDQLEITCGKNY